MRNNLRLLSCVLATTSLTGIAYAADPGSVAPAPAAASTQPNPDSRFNGTVDTGENVTVHGTGITTATGVRNTTPGGGLMAVQTGTKIRNTVTRDYIAKQAPTSNTFALVQNLPGVVVAGSDPFGESDRMTLSVRGLGQTELGYVFEGMPVGDQISYSAFPSEWADTDNIGTVSLTRGSTDITAPVYNSVGALFQEDMITPGHRPGGYLDLSYGSDALNKEFLRLETGDIGRTGFRGFTSFSYSSNDNWRGPGGQFRYHIDSKFIKEWGDGNSFTPMLSWNRQKVTIFTQPTMAQWKEYGSNYNYDPTYTNGDTNYYGFHFTERQSLYTSQKTNFNLGSGVTLTVTPYFLWTHGVVNGSRTLNPSDSFYGIDQVSVLVPPGTPNPATVENIDLYTQNTGGENSYFTFNLGNSAIRLGYWYSYFDHNELSSYELANSAGVVPNSYGQYALATASGQVLRGFAGHLIQQLNSLYVDDTIKLMNDKLLLNAGFKEVMVSRRVTDPLPGATYATGNNDAQPLPQISARYSVTDRDQVFSDVTTAFREPSAISSYIDLYNVGTGLPTSSHSTNLRSEYSIGEEIGYRHHGLINAQVAFYNYNLTNRQVTSSAIVNGTSVSTSVNVGGQTARGVEGEIGLRPWHSWSPYVSAQYLHATTDNNYRSGVDYLPTAGKIATLSPRFVGSAGLFYDDGHIFGNGEVSYVSSQYTTFMDDEEMPGYYTANVAIGYRLRNIGFARHPQIQLNLNNIANEHYLSGVYGITSNAKATRGVFGTTIAGSAPTYYVGGGFAGVVSVSTGF